MQTVGFVGLGAMGAPMARTLADAGHPLVVYNRTEARTEPFAEAGHAVRESPAAVAAEADAVFVMVTGPEALRAVVTGEESIVEGLAEGTVVVNTSTVSHDATTAAATAVADAGGRYVDAPVLGTVGPAEEGDLVVLASGDDDAIAAVRDPLDAIGSSVFDCGAVGQGTTMKLTTNLLLGNLMEAFAEALAFGTAHDLPLDTVLDVIDDGVLGAPLFAVKGDAVRERSFDPQFPVDLLFKDLSLALDAAGDAEVPLPATAATREAVGATRALGFGGEDVAALVKHLEATTGTTIGE